MIRSALMTVMTNAAIKAGRGLKRDFGEVSELQVSMKGPGDFVSLADKRAEKSLYEELAKARPGYGFVLEEGGRVEGTDESHTWHIDPLDATTNFLHAIPLFAISIALEREGQIVAGVIYNPANDDMYVTEKGQGACGRNGPRCQCAADGLRRARSGLCRSGPLRRLLGARPEFVGHRCWLAPYPRSRRFRERRRRRGQFPRDGLYLLRQRSHASGVARTLACGRLTASIQRVLGAQQ